MVDFLQINDRTQCSVLHVHSSSCAWVLRLDALSSQASRQKSPLENPMRFCRIGDQERVAGQETRSVLRVDPRTENGDVFAAEEIQSRIERIKT